MMPENHDWTCIKEHFTDAFNFGVWLTPEAGALASQGYHGVNSASRYYDDNAIIT